MSSHSLRFVVFLLDRRIVTEWHPPHPKNMPSFSSELFNPIVATVDDVDSLKACSFAGRIFRVPSQRIQVVLHPITLSGWAKPPNYDATRGLLEKSPRIAAYITTLKLRPNLRVKDTSSLP
jgi:hypothetical protein